MKKLSYLIVLALILGLVLTGCTLLSNIGQTPTSEQSGITYLTKGSSSSLVGLWHFDETSGTTASDSSGNGNTGTLTNMDTATCWVDGKFGKALNFDGANNYVDFGSDASLQLIDEFTIELWVNRTDKTTFERFLSHSIDKNTFAYEVGVDYLNPDQWRLFLNSGAAVLKVTMAEEAGQWIHVAFVYDRSLSSDNMKIYENGILVDSGNYNMPLTNHGTLRTNRQGKTDGWLKSTIDEVRIWDRALTYAEITNNYNNSSKEVIIDIKPGSYPNSINLGSKGVVPVAILGSADFDAATVNPSTITLAGAGVKLKGNSGNAGSLEDVDGDVYPDLVVQVYTEDLGLATGDVDAVLNAYTYTGLTFLIGSDVIRIVPQE